MLTIQTTFSETMVYTKLIKQNKMLPYITQGQRKGNSVVFIPINRTHNHDGNRYLGSVLSVTNYEWGQRTILAGRSIKNIDLDIEVVP